MQFHPWFSLIQIAMNQLLFFSWLFWLFIVAQLEMISKIIFFCLLRILFLLETNLSTSITGIAMVGLKHFVGLVLLQVLAFFLNTNYFHLLLFPCFSNLLFLVKYDDVFSTISQLMSELILLVILYLSTAFPRKLADLRK